MLNILQTGDLHLGKVLYEYSLIEDQHYILNQLLAELKSFFYDVLIISGDVYDRSIPSPEAVRLFDDFLTTLSNDFPTLVVCIISGNHDSSARLSFASSFFKSKNIYIATKADDCDKPVLLSKDGELQAALYQIPFLQIGALKSINGTYLKTQEDLVTEAIHRIQSSHTDIENEKKRKIPAIINCHLFTLKGTTSDSERLFLGNAELINPEVFNQFAYVAIGHLHKKQKVTESAYYSGSPLAYSFSEAQTDKCFLRVQMQTIDTNNITVTPIAITPLRKLVQIEARFEDFEKMTEHKDNFIEFTCTNEVAVENIASKLRKTFPFLLAIKQKAIISLYESTEESLSKKRALFEKKEALPLKEILFSFIQNLGLISEASETLEKSEWDNCITLFEQTAKELEAEKNEAN